MVLKLRSHILFVAVLLGCLASSAPVRAELPAESDTFTFVTDEETGALYECNAEGCRLVASPLQAEAVESCLQCTKSEIRLGLCAVEDTGKKHCRAANGTTAL